MAKAFVLVNSEQGLDKELVKELETIEAVTEAYRVYSVYDIIACIEAESMNELKIVAQNIRRLEKVRTTLTMLVI